MLAAVRWDLGNRLPNNFLSNTREVLTQNETFFVPFTTTTENSGDLFDYLTVNPWNTTNSVADLQLPNPPLFLVSFLCHLSKFKSPLSAFVSILVGTLSICTSSWKLLLHVSAWLYKHSLPEKARENFNYCQAHVQPALHPDVLAVIRAAVQEAAKPTVQKQIQAAVQPPIQTAIQTLVLEQIQQPVQAAVQAAIQAVVQAAV